MSDRDCELQNISVAGELHASTSTASCASEGSVVEVLRVPTIVSGKYFSLVKEKSNHKTIVGQCQFCLPKDIEIKGQVTSSSNFLSHLKRKHYEAFTEYSTELGTNKQTASGSSAIDKQTISQNQFEMDIAEFVIDAMVPLKVVDSKYFRKIFINQKLGNKVNAISRRRLGRILDKRYTECMCNIKSQLESVQFVCTTADIWSGRRRSFLGVTAHWISTNYERKSAALACRRFAGEHSFATITDLLKSIHTEFGLTETQIVATVTDNASNFAKAFRTFGVKAAFIRKEVEEDNSDVSSYSSSDEEPQETTPLDTDVTRPLQYILPRHIKCAAHTLNLCITSDMMRTIKCDDVLSVVHKDAMHRCNLLWNAAIRPKSAEIILEAIGHTLRRPGETRWNSLYDSLKQILKIKNKMTDLTKLLGIKIVLRENDFTYLEEHIECTAPIAEAIDILQGDNIFYGTLLPCLLSLRLKLQILEEKEWKFCNPISQCLRYAVNSRFEDYLKLATPESQNAAMAGLTHPEFKNAWFPCITEEDRGKMEELLKHEIIEEMKANTASGRTEATTSSGRKSRNSFFDFGATSSLGTAEYSSKASLEVSIFFHLVNI